MSEISETTICNDALLLLSGGKESVIIEDINDSDDTVAKQCARIFPYVRDVILVAVRPLYSCKFDDCGAQLTGTSLPEAAGWDYVFNLPPDCLDAQVLYQADYNDPTAHYDHFIFGNYFCTDTLSNEDGDSAYLFYLWKLENVKLMSSALRWAIACELAHRLSGILAPELMAYLKRQAEDALTGALCKDGRLYYQKKATTWFEARTS